MRQSVKFLGLVTLFVLVLIFISAIFRGQSSGNLVNPKPWILFTKGEEKKTLKVVVDELLKDAEGKYGIVIKNLKTNEEYSLNEDEIFQTASLYKLWVMATVFEKLKSGELTEDESVIANIPRLNSIFGIDPDEAELTEGVIQFSVKSATEQMITITHNYAAMALIVKVGKSEIDDYLSDHGYSKTKFGDIYTTTASEVTLFYENLYKEVIKNDEHAKQMMDILKRQTINDRIPKGLPEGTIVAHKTGDLGYFEHDAGIVFSEGGDFIVVFLTETDHPDKADEKMIEISQAVYDYFNK